MKAEKIITSPVNIEITEVTLLSIEEYEACFDSIPMIDDWWWLRSPGFYSGLAAGVDSDGSVRSGGRYVNRGGSAVRPAFRIRNLKSSDLQIKDRLVLAGYTWTIIADNLALCDSPVDYTCFRMDYKANDANDYEASDIKKWLADWVKENGIEFEGTK